MKLKKTWMGICVWVLYLGGIIFALEFTGLISGLLRLLAGAIRPVELLRYALAVAVLIPAAPPFRNP